VQLVLGYGFHQPTGYRGFVIVTIEFMQIVGIERPAPLMIFPNVSHSTA
jgi:hypothetical protein